MSKRFEAQILDLGAGLNDSFDPSILSPRFSSILDNFALYGPHAHRRNGIIRQSLVPSDEHITGLFAFGKMPGSWALILGGQTKLSVLQAGVPVDLVNADGVTIPTSDDIWRMIQYKGTGYAVRPGVDAMLRFDDTKFSVAGINAPLTAPTIANVVGGRMEAGTRHVVMTFFNPDTDVESNPSPVSNVDTLIADDKIQITGAELPTDPQVGGRRFYVTLPNIEGQYYLALETLDTTSTGPFYINRIIDELGNLASFKNYPPERLAYIDIAAWKERVWITDGFSINFSQNINGIGQAEAFNPSDNIEIYPDDRNHVTALRAFGERLIVAKTNGIYAILSAGASFEVQVISDRQGCAAGGSMCVGEGFLYWYSGENVYRTNGSAIQILSDPPATGGSGIRALLDSVPDEFKDKVQGSIYPLLGWYVLAVPTGDSEVPTHTAIYDYRNSRWFIFTHSEFGAPTVFGDFLDGVEQPRVFCAYYGSNHVYDFIGTADTLDDDGVPIECEWRSAGSNCGAPGYLHVLIRAGLLVDPIRAKCNVYAYENGSNVASVKRVGVNLHNLRQLQRVSLPSVKSFHSQVGLTYNELPRLVLKGAHLEADVFGYKEPPE